MSSVVERANSHCLVFWSESLASHRVQDVVAGLSAELVKGEQETSADGIMTHISRKNAH